MNAITEVREQAIRSCLQAGFTLKQIATVLHVDTDPDVLEDDEEFHAAGCVCLDCSTGDFDSDDMRAGMPSRA